MTGKYILLGMIAFSSGVTVAAGLFALVASLGVLTRLAQVTRTAKYVHIYEYAVSFGAFAGNYLWMYEPPMGLGITGTLIFGLLSGIYVGCLVSALEEVIDAFPAVFRKLNLKRGTGIVIFALAAGKFAGVLIQYIFSKH